MLKFAISGKDGIKRIIKIMSMNIFDILLLLLLGCTERVKTTGTESRIRNKHTEGSRQHCQKYLINDKR